MSEATPIPFDPKVTWDDDCEQIVIEHPVDGPPDKTPQHIHHRRLAIIRKTADSIVLEPQIVSSMDDKKFGHEKQYTYVRTKNADDKGRAIFRQGVA